MRSGAGGCQIRSSSLTPTRRACHLTDDRYPCVGVGVRVVGPHYAADPSQPALSGFALTADSLEGRLHCVNCDVGDETGGNRQQKRPSKTMTVDEGPFLLRNLGRGEWI
jgi:hypothetical protein